jgi:hypothetical protein
MAHASSPFPVPVCTRLLLSVRTFGEGNSCRNKKSLQPLQVQQPLKLLVMPTLTWALNPVMAAVSGITWCKKINGWFFFSLWFAVYHRKKMTQGPVGSYTWDWSISSIGHTLCHLMLLFKDHWVNWTFTSHETKHKGFLNLGQLNWSLKCFKTVVPSLSFKL